MPSSYLTPPRQKSNPNARNIHGHHRAIEETPLEGFQSFRLEAVHNQRRADLATSQTYLLGRFVRAGIRVPGFFLGVRAGIRVLYFPGANITITDGKTRAGLGTPAPDWAIILLGITLRLVLRTTTLTRKLRNQIVLAAHIGDHEENLAQGASRPPAGRLKETKCVTEILLVRTEIFDIRMINNGWGAI